MAGRTSITCTLAEVEDFEKFIQHVQGGVDTQQYIAELMGRPTGTISKWSNRAVDGGRITKTGNKLKAVSP